MAEVIGMADETIEWAPLAATVRTALAQKVRQQLRPPGSGLCGWQPRYDDLDTIVAHALAWEARLTDMPKVA